MLSTQSYLALYSFSAYSIDLTSTNSTSMLGFIGRNVSNNLSLGSLHNLERIFFITLSSPQPSFCTWLHSNKFIFIKSIEETINYPRVTPHEFNISTKKGAKASENLLQIHTEVVETILLLTIFHLSQPVFPCHNLKFVFEIIETSNPLQANSFHIFYNDMEHKNYSLIENVD